MKILSKEQESEIYREMCPFNNVGAKIDESIYRVDDKIKVRKIFVPIYVRIRRNGTLVKNEAYMSQSYFAKPYKV